MPEGLITARCRVPADLLNDETYQIDVLLVRDSSVVLHRQAEAISFAVADGPRSGPWQGKHAGVVRPRLDWRIGPAQE